MQDLAYYGRAGMGTRGPPKLRKSNAMYGLPDAGFVALNDFSEAQMPVTLSGDRHHCNCQRQQ
jgi:hypothetical protein